MSKAAAMERVRRDFWRCGRCLTVFATEGEPAGLRDLRCACGGACRSMGMVERGRLVHLEQRCACDARCTSARGPRCDCQCGGENHGTGRIVTVKWDMGGVPRATLDVAAAVRKAEEFEAVAGVLREEIEARYPELATKRRGEWVAAWDRFMEGRDFLQGINRTKRLKSHGGRMKALKRLKAYMYVVWGQDGGK